MFDEKLYRETFSQIHAPEETRSEVLKMTNRKNNNYIRFSRLIIIAAIITVMLATTAFAYVGFTQYENPMQMLKTFIRGDEYILDEGGFVRTETYYDSKWDVVYPTVEQIPLDGDLAEAEVAPYISDVGKTIHYGDYALTVEAHLYDSATGCGYIYYNLENPNGIIGYYLQHDGEISWSGVEVVSILGCAGKNYIVEEETTETVLSVAHYYCGAKGEPIEVGFFHDADAGKLFLSLEDGGGMKSISAGDGLFSISPIAMKFQITQMDFLGEYDADGVFVTPIDDANIWKLAIRYQDGTEYVVLCDEPYTRNYFYSLGDYTNLYYAFNRLVDVEKIDTVVINDVEYKVD